MKVVVVKASGMVNVVELENNSVGQIKSAISNNCVGLGFMPFVTIASEKTGFHVAFDKPYQHGIKPDSNIYRLYGNVVITKAGNGGQVVSLTEDDTAVIMAELAKLMKVYNR